jgi:hypothetical protein
LCGEEGCARNGTAPASVKGSIAGVTRRTIVHTVKELKIMRIRERALETAIAAVLLGTGIGAAAQDAPAPILSHGFEQNDGGWQAFPPDGTAAVSLTHDAASVKSGKGALQFSYALKKGAFCLLLLPTPDMILSPAKSIRFWVKADHSTSLACVLQEKDGGRYNAAFSVTKNVWQQVDLSTADFMLDISPTAPKDPDAKLDVDQVEAVGVIDVAQLFVQGDPALAAVFGISEGPRTLFLDDFAVNTTPLAPATTLKNGEGSFDTFARQQVGWIGTGEVQLTKVSGAPLEGVGMAAKYHQAPAKVVGFSRYVPGPALAGATKLSLSAASLRPAKIVVQVEEKGGGKYNTTVELPGNSGRADLTVKFADFKPAQDSKDDNNKLDLDQVVQIVFYDATGLLDNTDGDNTLWINNIKATR